MPRHATLDTDGKLPMAYIPDGLGGGSAGPTGETGPAGPTGATGPAGETGPSGVAASVSLASDQAFSTTSLADVTGMVLTLAANTDYVIELIGSFQSAATTTGIGLALWL